MSYGSSTKKLQVDHALRAAGRITGEKQFIIIGSQSLHGKHPDLADEILTSFEVDLIAAQDTDRATWLNFIGVDSPFHESSGFYIDPVDESTATLPKGWKGRLVNLPKGDTEGVQGLCREPHDLGQTPIDEPFRALIRTSIAAGFPGT